MSERIKVLIISPFYPFPEYKDGIRKIIYNLIKFKPENIQITILSLCEETDKDFFYLEDAFSDVRFEKIFYKDKPHKYYILEWLFSSLPVGCIKFKSYWEKLADFVNSEGRYYDVIHIETPFLAPVMRLINENLRQKLMLFPHDSLTMFVERRLRVEKSLLKRFAYKLELQKAKKLESGVYSKYKEVVFVSDMDANYVKNLNPEINSLYIPNGVDIEYFSPQGEGLVEKNSLIFTGNMTYEPNRQAALFLINEVMPLLTRKLPDAKLYLVGINSEYLKAFENENVIVTGFVKDIRKYIAKAKLYVSPLPFGSGIKNKVLEAMSMGKVVLGTPVSFEGIDGMENGKNAVVIDSMDSKIWGEKIFYYMQTDLGTIGDEARKLIERHFSWKEIVKRYGELYANSLSNR
jgi:glycosyltransferase involved in cell wall biosynthesis